ncbi:hypothetical protein Fmac_025538 [Flemingia macrophylla]|uniref:Clu domain-containing protein n=1 Tax=Flemingia macrophylla TaxID=520843 RepID=A0ABD1LUB1_9FABA
MAAKPGKGRGRKKASRNNHNNNNASSVNVTMEKNTAIVHEKQNAAETERKQGEKIEIQLTEEDTVMDIKQFLLESKETCYVTCYDLLLRANDGSVHHVHDYNVISEVYDITKGGVFLEMVPALYDDRSIRVHVRHTKELLSLSDPNAPLSASPVPQNEKEQNKARNSGDTLKSEVPELPGLDYTEDVSDLLNNVLPPPPEDVKCVESILFSAFNPPPRYRRLVGDLLYLDVTTLEGNALCITGSTRMFYVNSCTAENFDPRPNKATLEATTLAALLQKISPMFKKAFREILDQKAAAHCFENVQPVLLPNSWLGSYPVPDHRRNSDRAANSLTLLYGSEPLGMPREWNEELQTCRELPHTTPLERLMRDRALYRVTSDFVDAAISGAVGVINGCIPPINSTDPEHLYMFLHNNIFFSVAVDTDLQKLSKKSTDVKSKTWSTGTPHSSSDKSSDVQVPNGGDHDGSSSEDSINGIEVVQDIHPESGQAESDMATYASVNNDLNGTKAYLEADVPGLYNLAVAIIDYRGHRVLAQSVLPGILQGDSLDTLVYGSLDNGKKIVWNEDFHSKVLEAAKRLHLKEHSVIDGSGNISKLAVAVDSKGIIGSDKRHYLLDLLRVTPRDANYTGPGSQNCILRSELINVFCQNFMKEKKSKDAKEHFSASPESSDHLDEIVFNPNVFTEFKLAGSPEEIDADENNVRKVSQYLTDVVVPKFIEDLSAHRVTPIDGQTLTEALHAHGINVRYIGKDILRDTDDHDVAPALSHLFNCLFGRCHALGVKEYTGHQSPGKHSRRQARRRGRKSLRNSQPLYMLVDSETLWSDIHKFAVIKYKFELSADDRLCVKKIFVLRNLCLKVGVTIAARKYDLNSTRPFQTSDILDLCPIVKHSMPVSKEAKELVEMGKLQFDEVTGPMHRDVATCCRYVMVVSVYVKYLAMISYHNGDMGGSLAHTQRELIINERCLGLDHPDTAHRQSLFCSSCYCNMALFYHGLHHTELSLHYMARALLLLNLSSGPDHPDIASTFINVAMIYQDMKNTNIALRYLQEALKKNERLLGKEHIQTALCYHALAIAFNSIGAFNLSLQHEKRTFDILVNQLGEGDSKTRDALNWMNSFKMRELQGAGGSETSGLSVNKSLNAALIGETLPRGRGIDERAARAVAGVRRKAAAKGLLRPPVRVQAQAVSSLTQLLHFINSGMAPDAVKNGCAHPKKEDNDLPANDAKNDREQVPAGLGEGLTSLDAKKRKAKVGA